MKIFIGVLINVIFAGAILRGIYLYLFTESEKRTKLIDILKSKLPAGINEFRDQSFYPYILLPYDNRLLQPKEPIYLWSEDDSHLVEELYFHEVPTNSKIKMGRSDRYFYSELLKHFGDESPFHLASYSLNGYYPDICYLDKKNQTYIDIEIDESHTRTGQAIHYIIYKPGNSTIDYDINKERDISFINSGWIVIRLSEMMIRKNTSECISLISSVINNSEVSPNVSQIRHPRWSREDIKELIGRIKSK